MEFASKDRHKGGAVGGRYRRWKEKEKVNRWNFSTNVVLTHSRTEECRCQKPSTKKGFNESQSQGNFGKKFLIFFLNVTISASEKEFQERICFVELAWCAGWFMVVINVIIIRQRIDWMISTSCIWKIPAKTDYCHRHHHGATWGNETECSGWGETD